MLSLSRFEETTTKIQDQVSFQVDGLNIHKCVLPEMRGDQSLLYDCRAVIYHRGDDLRAGRYVAYVRESLRDEESQQWILYDDEVMSIAQQQDVMVGSLNPGHSWDKACANHKEGIELVRPNVPTSTGRPQSTGS